MPTATTSSSTASTSTSSSESGDETPRKRGVSYVDYFFPQIFYGEILLFLVRLVPEVLRLLLQQKPEELCWTCQLKKKPVRFHPSVGTFKVR